MQAVPPGSKQVGKHREAQPAADEQPGHGQIDRRVCHIPGEAAKVAHQVKPGVVERRDAVKHAVVHPPRQAEFGNPSRRQDQRPDRLDPQREQHDAASKAHDPPDGVEVVRLLQDEPIPQPDAPSDDHRHQRGHGHIPKPTELNEEHDHELTKQGVIRRGVDDDEPGHTRGRGGREQRDEERDRPARRRGDREREQERPSKDDRRKPEDDGLRGVELEPGEC